MKIICISGKAQHGKDTSAKFLQEQLENNGYRVKITHFADQLKHICKDYFGWDGVKDEKGRSILQHIGTEVIREKSPDYFADYLANFLSMFYDEWDYVIIPDCRFPNELEIFTAYGMDAILLRVVRPGFLSPLTQEQQAHPSETALDNYKHDFVIVNSGSKAELKSSIGHFTENFIRRAA